MGLEISDQVTGATGELCPFRFSGDVGASLVGVSGFEAYFDADVNYRIKNLSLEVLVQASVGSSVSATGRLHMNSGANNQLNAGSNVIMTALAWVGANAAKSVIFDTVEALQAPSESGEIELGEARSASRRPR